MELSLGRFPDDAAKVDRLGCCGGQISVSERVGCRFGEEFGRGPVMPAEGGDTDSDGGDSPPARIILKDRLQLKGSCDEASLGFQGSVLRRRISSRTGSGIERKVSTTRGSKWVPAQRRISVLAALKGMALE